MKQDQDEQSLKRYTLLVASNCIFDPFTGSWLIGYSGYRAAIWQWNLDAKLRITSYLLAR